MLSILRNRGITTLAFGHFTVDSYVGLLPVLYPLLIHRFALNLATVALVSLAYSGMASVSQPFFGLLADRFGTRFTGLALVWTATSFAAVGFMPNFPLLVAMAAASGLGSGAFHPLGALTVRGLLPKRGANTAMSIYVTGGTLGLAAGPLIGITVFGLFATRGTAVMMLPGLAIAAFLLVGMRAHAALPAARLPAVEPKRVPVLALAATIAVMASRSWTNSSLQNFTPTWYHQLGYQPWFYGPLTTTIILASALGTVGVGSLSEKWGRKGVTIASLVATLPAIALFVAFPGPLGFGWAALVGLTSASTAPLMLMLAQELMFARAGFASGLILGLGFVTAAIGTPITGLLADHFGLQASMALQLIVVLVTLPIALLLPSERFLREHRGVARRQSEPAPLRAESEAV